MRLRDVKGFSLIEIIISTAIFVIAATAVLGTIISTVYFIDITRDKNIAVSDLRNIMEDMRATPFDHITTQFPDSVTDGPAINQYPAILGGYTLINEHITVTYADAASDPLEIQITITWDDKRGRPYNISLSTFRTR